MHTTPTCNNCKNLIMHDPCRMIYKCLVRDLTLFNSDIHYKTCLCYEGKDDKTMLKHFCDICKKELKADEETFIFTIETFGDDPTYDSCHEEVCKDCRKQIEDYIDYLAYVKYKDGTKQ